MNSLNRRTFIAKTLKGTAGVIAISILPLGLTACNNKTRVDTSSMASLGPISELEKGEFPKKVPYKTTVQDAWVEQKMEGFVYVNKNKNEDSLIIMSPVCTHLGCIAGNAEQGMKEEGVAFYCPCHGGEYDEFGMNIGGPPPRPLDIFEAFVQDGIVYIAILSPTKRN
jgi:menaquinol-cytochrome c reductase iron-sulfur subunit